MVLKRVDATLQMDASSFVLMNTRYGLDNAHFTDDILYDKDYMMSLNVSNYKIDNTLLALDYLFSIPCVSSRENIWNMSSWEIMYYDNRGRTCFIEKNGENIYFIPNHTHAICVHENIAIPYLHNFRHRVRMLVDNMRPDTPTTITAETPD